MREEPKNLVGLACIYNIFLHKSTTWKDIYQKRFFLDKLICDYSKQLQRYSGLTKSKVKTKTFHMYGMLMITNTSIHKIVYTYEMILINYKTYVAASYSTSDISECNK